MEGGVHPVRLGAQRAVAGRGARALAGFLRFAIGAILLATAVGKLLDIPGFARVLGAYDAIPAGALVPIAVAVPLAELALALWLFSGKNLAASALISAAMHAGYALWSAVSVLRGLKLPNCGCFGVFLGRPLGWSTVFEDLVLVGASLGLWVLVRRRA
jgi:Methylamine utilisation protein MauE